MTSQQYSRLAVGNGAGGLDIALSRFSSTSSTNKMPAWQDTNLSQDLPPPERGFFGAIKGWWLELGSVALAFATLLCTAVLLAVYNGRPISETPRSPSLNTLVNIFSTIVAGLIVFVVAEILSQAKWLHMRSQKMLDDFNVIDNASRGLRGSVQVLFKPRLGAMSLIGAVATLLAVVIGPMLQETVILRTVWLPDTTRNASAPVSKLFAPPTNPELPKLDAGMKGTIINSLSSTNPSALTPNFGCSTGNCTYETPYTSLGVCHSCQKLEVARQCSANNCNYTLANGHIMGDFDIMNVSTAFNISTQMTRLFDHELLAQFDLVRVSVISLTNGPLCSTNGNNPDCTLANRDNTTQSKLFEGGAIGAYCDLALCTNTYTADVTESRISEKIIATTDARNSNLTQYFFMGSDGVRYDPAILPDQCYIDGKSYTLEEYKDSSNKSWTYTELQQTIGGGNSNYSSETAKVPVDCVFAMPLVTYESLLLFMNANPFFLDGSGSSDSDNGMAGGIFSFYPNTESPSRFINQVFGVEPLFNNGNASFGSIDAAFGRLASAMTTYMRQNSGQKNSDFAGIEAQLASLAPTAPGVLFRSQTIVIVQWYWIILPAVVLFTTCAYLTAAIIQGGVRDRKGNAQAHLWKSSALVPLLIGRKSQLAESMGALDGHQAMQALKKRRMTLVNSKDGWAIVDNEKSDSGGQAGRG